MVNLATVYIRHKTGTFRLHRTTHQKSRTANRVIKTTYLLRLVDILLEVFNEALLEEDGAGLEEEGEGAVNPMASSSSSESLGRLLLRELLLVEVDAGEAFLSVDMTVAFHLLLACTVK
ncbi:hypothetical protein BgiMline_033502 [Biomphalaria glabrata]|nr:hypothetical protein BgiMline_024601 [Biomphalaria glabrata]